MDINKIKIITPAELKEKLESGSDLQLVDVREDFEHEAFNIGGELIPLGDLMSEAKKIRQNAAVIFYCKKGIRSHIGIQKLQDKYGWQNLYNLQGGLEAWKKLSGVK